MAARRLGVQKCPLAVMEMLRLKYSLTGRRVRGRLQREAGPRPSRLDPEPPAPTLVTRPSLQRRAALAWLPAIASSLTRLPANAGVADSRAKRAAGRRSPSSPRRKAVISATRLPSNRRFRRAPLSRIDDAAVEPGCGNDEFSGPGANLIADSARVADLARPEGRHRGTARRSVGAPAQLSCPVRRPEPTCTGR
jgi:hypothetical protein